MTYIQGFVDGEDWGRVQLILANLEDIRKKLGKSFTIILYSILAQLGIDYENKPGRYEI